MITRWSTRFRRIRRWLSRSEWDVRLLGLPRSEGTESSPGLVMIQIDGLARHQLEAAIKRGRMPFLRKLMEREGYRLHDFYSGQPASTPAVQGELFYGQKCAVPAFDYYDRDTRQLKRMFEYESSTAVEARLRDAGQPGLLAGGSAYCDIYSGGADEVHFCAVNAGLPSKRHAVSPLRRLSFALWHCMSAVRILALVLVELVVAIVDLIRGSVRAREFTLELYSIASRVVVSVGLRELATIGALMDIARGLPIIHLNYLGYDEQAHRRGPSSAFAHWALRGTDNAIRQLWKAAQRSANRDYDVWIYSDHGQEHDVPYEIENGRIVHDAIAEILNKHLGQTVAEPSENGAEKSGAEKSGAEKSGAEKSGAVRGSRDPARAENNGEDGSLAGTSPKDRRKTAGKSSPPRYRAARSTWLGGGWLAKVLSGSLWESKAKPESPPLEDTAFVASAGPVGHIYLKQPATPAQRDAIARAIVTEARIPLVVRRETESTVRAFTEAGEFTLPEQAAEVFGSDHPFLSDVAQDFTQLCLHQDAGDFVICGFRLGRKPMSFPLENGSHAGPGYHETHGFALLSGDAPLPRREQAYLRGLDLRKAVMHRLGREQMQETHRFRPRLPELETLRIMTYNVHSCVGMDGKLSPARIARVIEQCDADVIALQELDVGRKRSGEIDQAHEIARLVGMSHHFHPTIQIAEESFGDAVLSHLPMRLVRRGELPRLENRNDLEPRGAIWVEIMLNGQPVQLINTHLGLNKAERLLQMQELVGPHWLDHEECAEPVILCGDLNAGPRSLAYRLLARRLRDAQCELTGHCPSATFFSTTPFNRIDHVFLSPGIRIQKIEVPRNHLTRVASDHLPLIITVAIERETILSAAEHNGTALKATSAGK